MAKAEAQIDDLAIAAEEAETKAAQAAEAEAEEAERQRLQRIRDLARERIEKAEAVDRAIADLAEPLAELADTSAQLADLIRNGSERDAVRRWRWSVVTRLGRTLQRHGIDDLPHNRNDRPIAEKLRVGAVDWTDKLIDELARRAAAGEEVERV